MRTKLLSLKTLLVICLMAIVGGVETWAQTTEKVDFTAQGYVDKEKVASYVGDNFSVAFSKGSNTSNPPMYPTYYKSGTSIRFYGGNTMTISSSTKIISKVKFTYSDNKYIPSAAKGYNLSSGSYSVKYNTWTADAKKQTQSVTFTNANTVQYRIMAIEVTFASTSSVAAPTFSEDSKSFSDKFGLTLSAGSDAAMIMYTTDGKTPSYKNNVGELYDEEAPISITHSTTVKAIAVSSKGEESDVVTKEYKLELPAPTISEATKTFTAPFTVSLSTKATAAEAILYTLDGTDPSWKNNATKYTEPIQISATTTLKAVSYATNGTSYEYSPIATATYTEQGDAPIVIWSENWSTFKKEDKPTQGENATYVCKDGASVTQIYDDALAGGESPELLINKKGGSLAITIKNLKGANEGLMFTFKTNQDNNKFSVSTENVSILKSDIIDNGTNSSNKKVFIWKYVMALNEGATSLTITLNNASSENFRVDDLELSTYSGVGSFKITEAGYGTYYSSKAYTMPKGVKGYTITGNEGTSLVMNEAYAAGAVVPAKTALVVEGAANKYYTLVADVAESTDLTPADADNKLHGSDEAETTYVDGTDVKYYKLSYNNEGNNLGFYWGSENGAAFTNGAHKAYLALDSETLLSQSRGFSLADLAHGVTTGINTTVKSATQSNFIYDLNGRRINSLNGAAKGVYIMNGQKVLVK